MVVREAIEPVAPIKQPGLERRLAVAVNALKDGKKSMEPIAREAGFQSAAGFSNLFRKHYGISPSKFRAQFH